MIDKIAQEAEEAAKKENRAQYDEENGKYSYEERSTCKI